jgi:hypothetical protein
LVLRLAVPEPVIQKLKSVTLSCRVNGVALPPTTFSKVGRDSYSQAVPPFAAAVAAVDCALDRFLPPGPVDKRELGVIVHGVGLQPN